MRHRLDQVARIWAVTAFVFWIVLLAVALGAGTGTARAADVNDAPALEQRRDEPQTSVEEVSRGVMCPSCDTTLDQSNSPAAESMRVWVEEAVEAGWTEQEIREGLVDEYGGDESILATPRAKGLGLMAWIVPALVVLIAAIGGVVLMRSWRRGPAIDAPTANDDDQTRSGSSSYSQSSASPSNSSPSTADAPPEPSSSSPR